MDLYHISQHLMWSPPSRDQAITAGSGWGASYSYHWMSLQISDNRFPQTFENFESLQLHTTAHMKSWTNKSALTNYPYERGRKPLPCGRRLALIDMSLFSASPALSFVSLCEHSEGISKRVLNSECQHYSPGMDMKKRGSTQQHQFPLFGFLNYSYLSWNGHYW